MAEDDVVQAKKKRTLLEKYDIPLNHLTYEYVRECNNGKELERIVKILRSGEEGLYPDLIKCAEERLRDLLPSSRVLLVEEPALTKSVLPAEQWNQVNNDLANWSGEMKLKEELLHEAGDSLVTADIPDIRSDKSMKTINNEDRERKKNKSVMPRAYSEWEKYDAEKEILRMDLEEEIRREDLEKKNILSGKDSSLKSLSRPKVAGSGDYSSVEKQFLATQEKDKGNEYFKVKEYKLALEHYTTSIMIEPSPVAYNNRAMAYLKLEKYFEALRDCNKVLEIEPNNVKALHRRGLAHKNTHSYQSALDDFSKILQLEPVNKLASACAEEMHVKLGNYRKSVRMDITEVEESGNGPKIVEILEESIMDEPCLRDPSAKVNTSWPALPDRKFKCNEFGLPKIMCNCSGVPEWVRRPPPKCLVCKEIKEKRKKEQMLDQDKNNCDSVETRTYAEDSESDEESSCNHSKIHSEKTENVFVPSKETSEETLPVPSLTHSIDSNKKDTFNNAENKIDDTTKDDSSVSKEGTSRSSLTSPKVKSGRKIEARRLLPPESIKPVKVQVASKYTTKTVLKGEEDSTRGVQAIQGLTLEDGSCEKISSPFEFVNALQGVKGEDPVALASVLQRVDPSDLHALIGNKLDDVMLRSIVVCLEKCFMNNGAFVLKFLENLVSLPRFTIVKMFLDSKTKEVLEHVFVNLKNQGFSPPDHLQESFKL